MDSTATLLSGLLFGSIGVGYLIYGKKQQRQAALFSGIALIGLHKLKDLDPRAIVTHFSGVALLASIVACFVFPWEASQPVTASTLLLLLGVGGSATIGQLMLTKAFTAGNAARVSVVGLSQVAIVMLLEAIIWRRTFDFQTLFGMSLVVAPTAWMILRRAR